MPVRTKIRFTKFISLWGITALLILTFVLVIIEILDTERSMHNRIKSLQENYKEERKTEAKQWVEHSLGRIVFERNALEAEINNQVCMHVESAVSTAKHLYNEFKDSKPDKELKELILEALRIKHLASNDLGCFVSNAQNQEVLLSSVNPNHEGELTKEAAKKIQNLVVQHSNETTEKRGGFFQFENKVMLPNGKESTESFTGYVEYIEELNWSIGSSCMNKILRDKVQKSIIERYSTVRFGKNQTGYLFIFSFDGTALMHDFQPYREGKNYWELKDAHGIKVIQELKRTSDQEGGGYVEYSWENPLNNKLSQKISYVTSFPEWEWLLGAGVYLDEIEAETQEIKQSMTKQLQRKILTFLGIVLLVLVLMGSLFFIFNNQLKKDIDLFISFFKRSTTSNEMIDTNEVRFIEFATLSGYANTMLEGKICAERELVAEKEQLMVTLKSIGDGVITTNLNGEIELMNPIAEELTGWKQEKASGRKLPEVFKIIDSDSRKEVPNPCEAVLKSGKIIALSDHTVLLSKDEKEYRIADSASPILDFNNEIKGVVLIFRDVTDKVNMEEVLFNARKLESIGLLAGGIAHDFNNILTGIFGNMSLAKLKVKPGSEEEQYLDSAMASIEKATSLTNQLLTFAKGGDPIIESVNIRTLISSSVKFNLSGSNIQAKFNLPKDLWQIKADKGQIDQVLANLTINAKQSMQSGGIIEVSAGNVSFSEGDSDTDLTGKFVKIKFCDNGAGIPSQRLKQIFDPYFSTKESGFGLGLATAHSIIKKHNGRISVSSVVGEGTYFTILLPADSSPGKDLKKTSDASPILERPGKNRDYRILLMDDEELVREVASDMLSELGYKVSGSVDGRDCIKQYIAAQEDGKPFDAIIMDLTIPGGMGGKDTITRILAINPIAKCIVSSGYSDDPVIANFEEFGFSGRLTKPFLLPDLGRELARLLLVDS